MEKILLKDMPEFAERIEGNAILEINIKEILDEYSHWSETRQGNVIDDIDFNRVVTAIIEKTTEFVNQNYTFKGV